MAVTGWRIVKERHAAGAFSGEGARLYGGRWNHRGTSVVYLADSLALSALELFVHVGRDAVAIRFVSFRVDVPDHVAVEELARPSLPAGWYDEPPSEATKDLGTAWAARAAAPVLRVPSVIVPTEWNLVLNPTQRDFAKLRIGDPQPFSFDPRMWK